MSGSGQMKTLTEGPKTRNFNLIRKKLNLVLSGRKSAREVFFSHSN
jgi:hypothetical protein